MTPQETLELNNEIHGSTVFRTYNTLKKIKSEFLLDWKILFILSLLLGILSGGGIISYLGIGLTAGTGILFAFTIGIFHYLSGRKREMLMKKYDIGEFEFNQYMYFYNGKL